MIARIPEAGPPNAPTTLAELTWREKRIEHWLRFGQPCHEQRIDRHRRIVGFAADHVFALLRWAGSEFGTVASRLDILRTVEPGASYQTLPFIRPGAEILLRVTGWPKVERVLQAIDAIEALAIDPCDVAPDHWRHIHNRIATGAPFRTYTKAQHTAWLKRRRAAP